MIVLMLLLTAFAYMFVPIIALIANEGRFDKRNAKKIALWNSIIAGVLFFMITTITMPEATWNSGAAIVYFWINRAILTGKNATPHHWKVAVIAVNSSKNDRETVDKQISKYKPIYFHLILTGRNTNQSTKINVYYTLPNGETNMDTIPGEWRTGDYFRYGCDSLYENPEDGETGKLKCEFLDDDGNLFGVGEVEIID